MTDFPNIFGLLRVLRAEKSFSPEFCIGGEINE